MTWAATTLSSRLRLKFPILQAPMANASSVPMTVAVSAAGGLGSFGGAYLSPQEFRETITAIKSKTSDPFNMNSFIVAASSSHPFINQLDGRVAEVLEKWRVKLKISPLGLVSPPKKVPLSDAPNLIEIAYEERVPVYSFTFGALSKSWVRKFHSVGTVLMGTATNVAEAKELEALGIDFIIAQSGEAGGHRGTWIGSPYDSVIGSTALLSQLLAAVKTPIIAAGGISSGRGVAAALTMGACGVAIGTAFLGSNECPWNSFAKQMLKDSTDRSSAISSAMSGRACRLLMNDFLRELKPLEHLLPPFPLWLALTADIRKAANEQQDRSAATLLCGQGSALTEHNVSAAVIFDRIVKETTAAFGISNR